MRSTGTEHPGAGAAPLFDPEWSLAMRTSTLSLNDSIVESQTLPDNA
jgi:hypothetical protein